VLVVGGLPIAMPTVLSVTMALGASALAKKKAIVSRLTVVEEIAGMEILCSDKTGTLTKNELSVKDPVAYVGDLADVIFDAALAAKPENGDAIDMGIRAFQTFFWNSSACSHYTHSICPRCCAVQRWWAT
jgi:H+-transporting ATPase